MTQFISDANREFYICLLTSWCCKGGVKKDRISQYIKNDSRSKCPITKTRVLQSACHLMPQGKVGLLCGIYRWHQDRTVHATRTLCFTHLLGDTCVNTYGSTKVESCVVSHLPVHHRTLRIILVSNIIPHASLMFFLQVR